MGICNGNFGHFSTKSAPCVHTSFAAETRSFFPIFRAQENIPATCARNPLILRALAGIIPRQVHTEWYRSGYNGPDSKSGVPATVPWVRIPPTPPASTVVHTFFLSENVRHSADTTKRKKRPYYQITAVLHMPCGRFSRSYKIEKPRRLIQPSRFSQVFLMNCSPHLGQRILMRPFPRGTRTTCRQRGQVKYRFCRSRSLVKKRWKAAFSRRRASMLRE